MAFKSYDNRAIVQEMYSTTAEIVFPKSFWGLAPYREYYVSDYRDNINFYPTNNYLNDIKRNGFLFVARIG